MADTYRRGNRTQARQAATLVVSLYGLPAIGAHVGGGVHVVMPPAFIFQRVNPGWTSLHGLITRRLHPTNDDWGCLFTDETKALFADPVVRDAAMTAQQQTAFQTLLNTSIALDALWNDAPVIDDNPLERNGA